MSFLDGVVERFDGWKNPVTGLGTIRDKIMAYAFHREGRTDDETLEALYDEDAMAARICDAPAEHMLREGFTIEVEGEPDVGPAMLKYLTRLQAVRELTDAMVWERAFGGSVVVLGADDGQPVDQPLDPNAIRSIRFLNTLDKRDVIATYWYSDPTRPKYGKPAVYRITYLVNGIAPPGQEQPPASRTLLVHESRMLVFPGLRTTMRSRIRYSGWGTPALGRAVPALKGYAANWQSIENMLSDASQGVFAIKDLTKMIAGKDKDALMNRMTMMDMGRSVARSIMVDAESERFERKDTSMSGLPDLIDRFSARLAAVAKMPVTVLMGISPAGLNATGESDIRTWYDTLAAEREQRLRPHIERLVRLAFLAKDGPTQGRVPAKWELKFPSLWQTTEQEEATIDLTRAQTDQALTAAQIITPEEAALAYWAKKRGLDTGAREAAVKAYGADLSTGEGDVSTGRVPIEPLGASSAPALPAPTTGPTTSSP